MAEFLDKMRAEEIIRKLLPGSSEITFIDHGFNNLIAVVDKKYTFRTPKSIEGLARFNFETQILQSLSGHLDLFIPSLIKTSFDPPYFIASFLPGEHLENRDIRALGPHKQAEIGSQLATFSYQLNRALSPSNVKTMRQSTKVDDISEPWVPYLEKVFSVRQQNKQLEKLNQYYYKLWQKVNEKESKGIVIHDDLHAENLLFENGKLVGILDFEQINVGTIEQEFSDLYRLSEEILGPAITKYEGLTGQSVDVEAVKIWAITAELAAFSRQINKHDENHPSFKRAQAKLRYWFSDFPL